jgi:hypothetical protein
MRRRALLALPLAAAPATVTAPAEPPFVVDDAAFRAALEEARLLLAGYVRSDAAVIAAWNAAQPSPEVERCAFMQLSKALRASAPPRAA